MSDELIIKMIMDYGKFCNSYWAEFDADYEIKNVRIKGDIVFYEIRDEHYTENGEIELLELLAWVYSNATI